MYIISGKLSMSHPLDGLESGTMTEQNGRTGISTFNRFIELPPHMAARIEKMPVGMSVRVEYPDGDVIRITKIDPSQLIPEREL